MNMKIVEITEKLYKQEIDPNEAERLLLDLFAVSGSAYRDELLNKLDSMVVTANRLFTEEVKKVTEMVIDNAKHHVSEIAKKHYR